MLEAIGSLTILGGGMGILLGFAAQKLKVEGNPLVEEIESLLPGSQCGQCGFPGCSPAAAAIAEGTADVTCCPPGGKSLAQALADKMGVTVDLSAIEDSGPLVAFVNEELCIGCTRCFKRCPTDAIVGASKQMHVIIEDACTGCQKCVDICPTECIFMKPLPVTLQTWYWPKPEQAA
jgi:H+/Na+-translocating ferredoxin:NAD+ oxidoreductase subunit B